MMTNFPWDIVLLAILALVMAGALFFVLGRRVGAQGLKQEASPSGRTNGSRQMDDKTMSLQPPPLPNQSAPEEPLTEYVIPESRSDLSEELMRLQQKSPGFNSELFLKQVEVFFRDVVSAFAKADLDSLKNYLAPDAFDTFKSLIEERHKEGRQAFCEIKRIEKLEYKNVTLSAAGDETARLETALFEIAITSWQISNVRDMEKNIVDGTEALTEYHDIWGISCSLQGNDLKLVSASVF